VPTNSRDDKEGKGKGKKGGRRDVSYPSNWVNDSVKQGGKKRKGSLSLISRIVFTELGGERQRVFTSL